MSEISLFSYEDREVRTIPGDDGEVWFVAADVCAVLEIANARQAVASLDEDEVRQGPVTTTDGSGRVLPTNLINEPGLYSLILRSRKPEAKTFKRWITHEVLPQIRRTGAYAQPEVRPTSQIDVLRAALDQIEAAQQTAEEAKQIATTTGARLDAIEGKHDWYSGLAYAKLQGWPTSVAYLQQLGRGAGRHGRAGGLPPSKVQHGLYGQVNQWPAWCWDKAYDELEAGAA